MLFSVWDSHLSLSRSWECVILCNTPPEKVTAIANVVTFLFFVTPLEEAAIVVVAITLFCSVTPLQEEVMVVVIIVAVFYSTTPP
jgi:hypothetical protein